MQINGEQIMLLVHFYILIFSLMSLLEHKSFLIDYSFIEQTVAPCCILILTFTFFIFREPDIRPFPVLVIFVPDLVKSLSFLWSLEGCKDLECLLLLSLLISLISQNLPVLNLNVP